MVPAFIIVTVVAAAANILSAGYDFVRDEPILASMDAAGVPRSWLTTLGILKAAAALGLLVGIAVSPVAIAAASGLILFFLGAIITDLRGRLTDFTLLIVFLALAVAALGPRLATA